MKDAWGLTIEFSFPRRTGDPQSVASPRAFSAGPLWFLPRKCPSRFRVLRKRPLSPPFAARTRMCTLHRRDWPWGPVTGVLSMPPLILAGCRAGTDLTPARAAFLLFREDYLPARDFSLSDEFCEPAVVSQGSVISRYPGLTGLRRITSPNRASSATNKPGPLLFPPATPS